MTQDVGSGVDLLAARVDALVARLSLEQKLHQLSGDVPPSPRGLVRIARYNSGAFPSGEDAVTGIPPFRFADGPRGVVLGRSTAFPVSMARGASWDPDLEARIGDAIGVELRSQGADLFGGVCINLLRHPAWGRAQETYGEDPVHVGEMGAALVRGVQRHAMACIKHYACNSIENSRFRVSVEIDERTLREVYLPHFRRCIDEGAAVVMTAYNKVNGERCGHHAWLVRDVLKGEWGFEGFTISDFFLGVRDGAAGLRGGLDVEMPIRWRYGRRLRRAIERGAVDEGLVDDAVRRVVRTKLAFAGVGEPEHYGSDAVASVEHRALAREAAIRGMVLLRNETVDGAPALPARDGEQVAVIGKLADLPVIGDRGSSMVNPPDVVTPLAGLRGALGDRVDASPSGDIGAAVACAGRADLAVVVVGYTFRDEGEYVLAYGGDRSSLRLRPADEELIRAVARVNPRTVVVLVAGSAIVTEAWRHAVAGIVMAWYPGMQGGHALADLLTGVASFSGRLPCTFPRDEADLPPFDAKARRITYEYLHGYRWVQARGHAPAYPFGFGLSYTTFAYGDVHAEVRGDEVVLAVAVTNTGSRAGVEVVQVYVTKPDGAPQPQAPRTLAGFARVELAAGARSDVEVAVPLERLRSWVDGAWELVEGAYTFGVGPNSDPATQRLVSVDLTAS
ncbi:MAG: glycoside hydrolase family 3 C-terminal domain-containing protein [Actinobacteria bacterium]|nr:glycoside hydrolase family 3 C-terminal domain-containing protein [Actinomycetota bacterium]